MTSRIDFYFGLGSRYSYLAATQIAKLECETGATVTWHPVTSGLLIAGEGRDPFSGPPISGQYDWDYRRRDAEDWAAFYGVPFRDPVGRLHYPSDLLAFAALAAGRQGELVAMCHRMFRLIFVDDRTKFDEHDVAEEAREIGLDLERFNRDLADPALRIEHNELADAARKRGAFGVPTFFIGERLFWGNDRLALVAVAIRGEI
jgi:2-hydroxychromene-2-carboxylate isomerase